jgi:hypothetical protein
LGLISNTISQEIKFINAFGKPLPQSEIVIYGSGNDTLFTNEKGIVNLKKRKHFDSITFINNAHEKFTKTKKRISK